MSESVRLDHEKPDCLSSLAHELKNPLTSIIGFLEMLREQKMTPERQLRCLSLCYEDAQRMRRMLDDIGLIDRFDHDLLHVRLGVHRFDDLLSRMVGSYAERFPERKFSLLFEAENVTAEYDEVLLSQVLDNLLSNAVKYTADGGIVVVKQAVRDQRLLISVADNGIGIAGEYIPYIFEKYYRVSNPDTCRVGGLGLGLANTRRILEEHGGSIWVKSKAGEGTEFFFSLPLQAQL